MVLAFRMALKSGFDWGWRNTACSLLKPCSERLLELRVRSGLASGGLAADAEGGLKV